MEVGDASPLFFLRVRTRVPAHPAAGTLLPDTDMLTQTAQARTAVPEAQVDTELIH